MRPSKLALFGGKPVRTRPFTSWPAFGKPEEKQLEWVRSPKLMREIKERRERQKQAKNP